MKKLISFASALVLLAALAGCSSSGGSVSAPNNGSTPQNEPADDYVPGITAEDGYAEAFAGERVTTTFFDVTVNSAYICDEYYGYTPAEGNELLVVNTTVTNTMSGEIKMYVLDFQAQWDDDADDAYAWPITWDPENETAQDVVAEEQLPGNYELAAGETRTGTLVYEVPVNSSDFSVSYMEYFSDGSTGALYFIYFTADAAPAAA